jgi:hypothetical protein
VDGDPVTRHPGKSVPHAWRIRLSWARNGQRSANGLAHGCCAAPAPGTKLTSGSMQSMTPRSDAPSCGLSGCSAARARR